MDIVLLELKPIDDQTAELRYRVPGQVRYESRNLPLAEITRLYGFADSLPETLCEQDFTKNNPNLAKIGQQLFAWLDRTERWLSRSISQQRGCLVLAIDAQGCLGGLPWEILYYEGFLVARSIVPIRVVGGFQEPAPREPSPYQLRALFMATDPIDVHPKLNFEAEEALILAETRELAMELRVEESGCVAELKSFWRRFIDRFDVFHLSGHADIRDGVPFFITESLEGERVDASIEDFADAFQLRYPPLMFLSGCRTGESSQQGGVASLAAGLVAEGAPAVLGWGRPVGDVGAITAAMLLYRALAEGFSLAEALALTYRGLIKEDVPDWCLLRLYCRCGAWGELVLPPGDAVPQQLPEASTEFLDPLGLVKVAGKDGFVGRRRYLQQGLRALKSAKYLGIWLHGLGGVGKSTIACRLLDRLSPSYDRLVISGGLDAEKLLNLLGRKYETVKGNQILVNENLSLTARLAQFLQEGLPDPTRRLVFVLDDFEQNLELRGTGEAMVALGERSAGVERKLTPLGDREAGEVSVDNPPVLQAGVVEVLTALFEGIARSNLPHKVIIAVKVLYREWNKETGFSSEEQLLEIHRLAMWGSDGEIAVEMAQRLSNRWIAFSSFWVAQTICEESLLLQNDSVLIYNLSRIYEALGDLPKALDYCQQSIKICRKCGDCKGEAASLYQSSIIYQTLGDYPQALNYSQQSIKIHKEIGDRDGEAICIHQLSRIYEAVGNYSQALDYSQQSIEILKEIGDREGEAPLLHQLSRIYNALSDYSQALEYSRKSIKIYKEIGNRQGEAASIEQLSRIYKSSGDYTRTLKYSQQALAIQQEIGNRQGEAASLYQLSTIYEALGDYSQSLEYSQQSIKIDKEIGDRQGEGASLHQLSIIQYLLGNYPQALEYSQQSIKVCKEIGDRPGEAASLHQLSTIYETLGDYTQALILSRQSIKIFREIGNRQGEASSLERMATIAYQQGDIALERELRLQSVIIRGSIGDYWGLIITLRNLGVNDETDALKFFAQSLWLTVYCPTNLEDAITLIYAIYQKVPAGDSIQSLLGATALHFCKTHTHPEIAQLREYSSQLINHAANQQGLITQADIDKWFVTNQLNDPECALLQGLEAIIGDGWLFDRAAFLKDN